MEVGQDEGEAVERVEGAVIGAEAVGPFVVAGGVDEAGVEGVEPVEDLRVVGVIAAGGAAFGVADVNGEIDGLGGVGDDAFEPRFVGGAVGCRR